MRRRWRRTPRTWTRSVCFWWALRRALSWCGTRTQWVPPSSASFNCHPPLRCYAWLGYSTLSGGKRNTSCKLGGGRLLLIRSVLSIVWRLPAWYPLFSSQGGRRMQRWETVQREERRCSRHRRAYRQRDRYRKPDGSSRQAGQGIYPILTSFV